MINKKRVRSENEVKFSASSYAIYKRCPHVFNISVIHRIRAVEDKRNAAPGLALHALLEECFHVKIKDPKDAHARFDASFDHTIRKEQIKFTTEVEREKCRRDVKGLIDTTFSLLEQNNLFPYGEKDTVEERFDEYFDDDLLISGRSDICIERGGHVTGIDDRFLEVLDLKVTFYPQRMDKDQLYIYALALSQKRGVPVRKVGYIFPRVNKVFLPELEADRTSIILSKLNEAATQIRKGIFPYTPSADSCRFCFKRQMCSVAYNSDRTERLRKKIFQEIKPGDVLW